VNTRSPLDDLAAIVSEINAAARDRTRLSGLLNVLAECEIFESVVALGCKESYKQFVTFDARGSRDGADGWKSWPLQRLFDSMLLRRVAHPSRAISALAIPLDYGDERRVVFATLSDWALGADLQPFFSALESFAVPRGVRETALPENIPVSPVEPRVVCYRLCPTVQAVVDEMLERRGWRATVPRNFFELRRAVETIGPDVVFCDFDNDMDPMGTVLRMHSLLTIESKLVAFGNDKFHYLERQALVDTVLDHDASEPEIFSVLKRFARRIPELRKTRLRGMTAGFELALRDSSTPAELSATGARVAAGLMSGWASLHLVSETGTTYASEHPRTRTPVLTALPKTFLSDLPLFQLRVDERFYREISDDRRVVGALEMLHPLSAASIPLRQADFPVGSLVSVSRDAVVDSMTFQALDGFAGAVTRRFQEFSKGPALAPLFQLSGVWECVHHGDLEFAAYRSRSSAMAWDYRSIRPDFGLLVAGDEIDFPSTRTLSPNPRMAEEELADFVVKARDARRRLFVAACNPLASTITYAATGFPAPLLFDAAGPAGSVSARASVVRGRIEIVPPAGFLVWDAPLQRWLVQEGVEVQTITETLEDLRPPGVAIVITNVTRA